MGRKILTIIISRERVSACAYCACVYVCMCVWAYMSSSSQLSSCQLFGGTNVRHGRFQFSKPARLCDLLLLLLMLHKMLFHPMSCPLYSVFFFVHFSWFRGGHLGGTQLTRGARWMVSSIARSTHTEEEQAAT